jgi:hypothetical protein
MTQQTPILVDTLYGPILSTVIDAIEDFRDNKTLPSEVDDERFQRFILSVLSNLPIYVLDSSVLSATPEELTTLPVTVTFLLREVPHHMIGSVDNVMSHVGLS